MQRTILGKINVTFLVTLCLIGASIRLTNAADCGTCMESNYAYCINTTHFNPCYDGKTPTRNEVFQCPDDNVCTNGADICVAKDSLPQGITSVCESATCNTCTTTTSPRLACVSKTQFSLCLGGAPLSAAESCGPNEICHRESLVNGKSICVPESVANFLQYKPTCNNDETTTKSPVPTDPPKYDGLELHCAKQCRTKPYELCYTYNKNLPDCKSYIGCEKRTNEDKWDFFILQCPAGQFWKIVGVGGVCSTATCDDPTLMI